MCLVVRVVLYAEGPGETFGLDEHWSAANTTLGIMPPPGEALPEEVLGAGHLLMRRIICDRSRVPPGAIRFDAPLRTRGRVPRGSDLLDKEVLPQLLVWPRDRHRPDLAIVLVDRDGRVDRRSTLEQIAVPHPKIPCVVAVAREEFETWLVADMKAVKNMTGGTSVDLPGTIENRQPREVKRLLKGWLADRLDQDEIPHGRRQGATRRLRRDLAAVCDLAVLADRCPSFETLQEHLENVMKQLASDVST